MANKKAKSYAEHLVSKHMGYIKKSITNGDEVETIVLHILDKEGMKYMDVYEMADEMDAIILDIVSKM